MENNQGAAGTGARIGVEKCLKTPSEIYGRPLKYLNSLYTNFKLISDIFNNPKN